MAKGANGPVSGVICRGGPDRTGHFLGRPVTAGHATTAAATVGAGLCAHFLSLGLPGNILVAGSRLALMWPTTTQPQPEALEQVWALVNATRGAPEPARSNPVMAKVFAHDQHRQPARDAHQHQHADEAGRWDVSADQDPFAILRRGGPTASLTNLHGTLFSSLHIS